MTSKHSENLNVTSNQYDEDVSGARSFYEEIRVFCFEGIIQQQKLFIWNNVITVK